MLSHSTLKTYGGNRGPGILLFLAPIPRLFLGGRLLAPSAHPELLGDGSNSPNGPTQTHLDRRLAHGLSRRAQELGRLLDGEAVAQAQEEDVPVRLGGEVQDVLRVELP